MITKTASIEWVSKELGGRTIPPLGIPDPVYWAIVRFVEDPWPPTGTVWSLAVTKVSSSSDDLKWIADIHFMMDYAPHNELRDGREFELYEGRKCVAVGKILQTHAN